MALARPTRRASTDGSVGDTPLTVVDASAVSGLAILNLPGSWRTWATSRTARSSSSHPRTTNRARAFASSTARRRAKSKGRSRLLAGAQRVPGNHVHDWPDEVHDGHIYVYLSDGALLGQPGPGTLSVKGGASPGFTLRTPTPRTLSAFQFACLGP